MTNDEPELEEKQEKAHPKARVASHETSSLISWPASLHPLYLGYTVTLSWHGSQDHAKISNTKQKSTL